MTTDELIDQKLLQSALELGGLNTTRDTITLALQEFIARRDQAALVELFGTVDWDPEYEYKAERRARDDKHESLG